MEDRNIFFIKLHCVATCKYVILKNVTSFIIDINIFRTLKLLNTGSFRIWTSEFNLRPNSFTIKAWV
jgi:hypothetical protein